MNALIVHCHPEPRSFNATLTGQARTTLTGLGYTVQVSDLYAQGFDPVEAPHHYRNRSDADCFSALAEQRHASGNDTLAADVRREIARLEQADLVILQFPLWWHALPAMLKGWFDRVFVNGAIYTSRQRYDRGHFRGRRVLCSITTDAPATAFGPAARAGDVERLLWPVQYSLHYVGFAVLPPFVVFGIQGHGFTYQDTGAFRDHLAAEQTRWRRRLARLDDDVALDFPGWNDWDEAGRARNGVGAARA